MSVRTTDYRLDATGRLYDMRHDPGQTSDVAAAHPDMAARLRRIADDYRRDVMAAEQAPGRESVPVGFPGAVMTELTAGEAVPRGGLRSSSPHPNSSRSLNCQPCGRKP